MLAQLCHCLLPFAICTVLVMRPCSNLLGGTTATTELGLVGTRGTSLVGGGTAAESTLPGGAGTVALTATLAGGAEGTALAPGGTLWALGATLKRPARQEMQVVG